MFAEWISGRSGRGRRWLLCRSMRYFSRFWEWLERWFGDSGLADFEFEIILVDDPSCAFVDHADGDVAGLEAGGGQLEATIGADALGVAFEHRRITMERSDVSGPRQRTPLLQGFVHGGFAGCAPQRLQLFLERVKPGSGLSS